MSHFVKQTSQNCFTATSSSGAEFVRTIPSLLGSNIDEIESGKGGLIQQFAHDHWQDVTKFEVKINWGDVDSGNFYLEYTRGVDSDFFHSLDSLVSSSSFINIFLPFKDFSFVTTFDLSSAYRYDLITWIDTAAPGTCELVTGKIFADYGNSIVQNDDLLITLAGSVFFAGTSSSPAVELFPEFDYEDDKKKIESNTRLWNGDHYSYKSGEFDVVKFSTKYVPTSAANYVNSLYNGNIVSQFFVSDFNSYTSEVKEVRLAGTNKPFRKFTKPYIDLMDGKLHLETV